MDYKKVSLNNFNIHFINDKRYHSYCFRVFMTENVNEEKITYRNFIANILTYSSYKYNERIKLIRKCQDIYTTYPFAAVYRYGNLLTTKFTISTIDSLYIDKNNLINSINLLFEVILNPLVENNKFNQEVFDLIKKVEINDTKTIIEDSRLYANVEMLNKMDKNTNYNLTGYSNLKILKKINPSNLYQSYQKMLRESKIDIFISGNIIYQDQIINEIKKSLINIKPKYQLNDYWIRHTMKREDVQFYRKKTNNQQSKLSIGFKIYDMTLSEMQKVLPIYNIILGGNYSLLLQIIREEYMMAYYIYTYYNKLDSLIVLNSGISKNNYQQVINLINEILEKIKKGAFSNKMLASAKKEYIGELSSVFDNHIGSTEYIYGMDTFQSHDIKERIKFTKAIKKEDIMLLAGKVKMDTVFFLEGEL